MYGVGRWLVLSGGDQKSKLGRGFFANPYTVRREACLEVHHSPSIHDVHIVLLCGSLDGSNLLVSDHLTSVVVGNMSETAFPDEKACVRDNRVYVLSKLIRTVNFYNLCSRSSGQVPIPKFPARWRHLMTP